MGDYRDFFKKLWEYIVKFLKAISFGKIFTGLYFRKKKFYSTIFGGILTLLLFLCILILCINVLIGAFQGKSVTSTQQIQNSFQIGNKSLYDLIKQTDFTFYVYIYDYGLTCDDIQYNISFNRFNTSLTNFMIFNISLGLDCENGNEHLVFTIPNIEEYKNYEINNQTMIFMYLNNTKTDIQYDERMIMHYTTKNQIFNNQKLQEYQFISYQYIFGEAYASFFQVLAYNYTDSIWHINPTYNCDIYFQGQDYTQNYQLKDIFYNYTQDSPNQIFFYYFVTIYNQSVTIITVTPDSIFEAISKIGGFLSLLTLLKFLIECYNHCKLEKSLEKDFITSSQTDKVSDDESKQLTTFEQQLNEPLQEFIKVKDDLKDKFSFESMNRIVDKLESIDQKIANIYSLMMTSKGESKNNITQLVAESLEHDKIN